MNAHALRRCIARFMISGTPEIPNFLPGKHIVARSVSECGNYKAIFYKHNVTDRTVHVKDYPARPFFDVKEDQIHDKVEFEEYKEHGIMQYKMRVKTGYEREVVKYFSTETNIVCLDD